MELEEGIRDDSDWPYPYSCGRLVLCASKNELRALSNADHGAYRLVSIHDRQVADNALRAGGTVYAELRICSRNGWKIPENTLRLFTESCVRAWPDEVTWVEKNSKRL